MDRQVDDDVNLVVGEEVVERGVCPAAVLRGESHGAARIESVAATSRISGWVSGVRGVSAGDVAGPDDADAERGHGRRGYGIRAGRERPATPELAVPYRGPMRHDQIALQLYTVRDLAADDLRDPPVCGDGRLSRRRAAGLPEVPRPSSSGCSMTTVSGGRVPRGDRAPARRRRRRGRSPGELGCPRVIVPWMPEADRATAADVGRFAAELGEHARRMARDGIGLGYHNHDFEFAPLDGTTVWDVLLAGLPPEVELELDLYWAAVGGRIPSQRSGPSRIASGCST